MPPGVKVLDEYLRQQKLVGKNGLNHHGKTPLRGMNHYQTEEVAGKGRTGGEHRGPDHSSTRTGSEYQSIRRRDLSHQTNKLTSE